MLEKVKYFVRNNSAKLIVLAIGIGITILITGNPQDVFAPHRGR